MTATREDQLAARAQHPDTFVAVDDGDQVIGQLVSVKRAWSDARTNNGQNPERGHYPLLTVRVDSVKYREPGHEPEKGSLMKFHAFSTVAENEVLQARALPGERVRITYLGVSENRKKGQNAAKLFSFEVSGRSAEQAAESVYDSLNPVRATPVQQTPTIPPAAAAPATAADFEPQEAFGDDDDIPF